MKELSIDGKVGICILFTPVKLRKSIRKQRLKTICAWDDIFYFRVEREKTEGSFGEQFSNWNEIRALELLLWEILFPGWRNEFLIYVGDRSQPRRLSVETKYLRQSEASIPIHCWTPTNKFFVSLCVVFAETIIVSGGPSFKRTKQRTKWCLR